MNDTLEKIFRGDTPATDERIKARLREAGLAERTLPSLSKDEEAIAGIIIGEIIGADIRVEQMRESAASYPADAGKDVIDGKVCPTCNGTGRVKGTRESRGHRADYSKLRERDGELLDLSEDGIPMVKVVRTERMREGTFGGPELGTDKVYYEDEDTLPALQYLFTILPATLPNGTPNLENEIVLRMIEGIQNGRPLSTAEIGKAKELWTKYADQITTLRRKPDKDGQDYLGVPDPSTARLVESERRFQEDAEMLAAAELLGQTDEPEIQRLRESLDARRNALSDELEAANEPESADLLELDGVPMREAA
jgi:hypothetical protein